METGDADAHYTKIKIRKYLKWLQMFFLVIVWCVFTSFLLLKHEHELGAKVHTVPANETKVIELHAISDTKKNEFGILLKGRFAVVGRTADMYHLTVDMQRIEYDENTEKINIEKTEEWQLDIYDDDAAEHDDDVNMYKVMKFKGDKTDIVSGEVHSRKLFLNMATSVSKEFAVEVVINESPIPEKEGVLYASLVLAGLYVLIIWDLVHRAFAAIIASTMAIGILAILDNRPTMNTVMSWIDEETLLLLFGMMVIVAVLTDTGVFDYLAVYAYEITKGRVWPLINCLCFFTALFSSFLDNVTTVLLMTPVTIRLCEVMNLNPVPVLLFMVFYSNIGGTLTPVGDPPNVIIASNSIVLENGINFGVFTFHMMIPVILAMITANMQLRLIFRHKSKLRYQDTPEIESLKHEIGVYEHTAKSMAPSSANEDQLKSELLKKVELLKRKLKENDSAPLLSQSNYQLTLQSLQAKYPIRDKVLLIKCAIALTFTVGLFFLHALPQFQNISLGWTALLGAILLLILADVDDLEIVLERVEWSTLMFFAALFVLMEALSELGLIAAIGQMTENIILGVDQEYQLLVALMLMLWVSAITSAFVDNIPLTTMMIKVTISLAQNKSLNLPLQPLVWALALGACLGGNGTLIGASANVVCAGVAEAHGYKITFIEFFKVGFPIMINSIVVGSIYLIVAHVIFQWH